MKLSEVSRLLCTAQECNTIEDYLAECGGSLPDDSYYDHADKAIETLKVLYACRDGVNIQTLLALHGGGVTEFRKEYGLPKQTLWNWMTGHNAPPQYVLRLILADLI